MFKWSVGGQIYNFFAPLPEGHSPKKTYSYMCSIPSYFDCIYKLHDLSLKSLDGATKKGGRNRRRQHWAPYFFFLQKKYFFPFFLRDFVVIGKFLVPNCYIDFHGSFLFHFRTVEV